MDHEVFAYEQRQRRARFIARHGVWLGIALGLVMAIGIVLLVKFLAGGF